MFLKEFININEAGAIEPVVNLDMMNDLQKNLQLCKGFVFNYNSDRPKESTVGLMELLRRSFQSPNEARIHCVVQDYGKGKTHFALAIANFFSKAPDSPEVAGILNSIANATGEKNKAIHANLQSCKRGKHLVFCLRGDKGGDLRKHFLQVVLDTLNKERVTDSIAHHLCQRPLQYFEQLSDGDKVKGDRYLTKVKAPEGDLESLCELLRQNNHEVLPRVIEVADAITNGFAPNFTRNIEIEEILDDLVKNLCTGSNARFQGILILFDELNYYLDSWLTDKHLAGNTAPQNLTNACANHKAKIALMSFTQVNPNSKSTRDGFQQISTRLAPADATYSPVSSLEKVLDDVILQESEKWQTFRKKWDNTLWATSERTYKLARKYQDGQNLNQKEFHDHLGLGCFPLHPLAGYLLCNLEFTQGRTAIEFVKKEVGEFLEQSTEVQQPNRPNYLHSISLVDAFAPNFKTSKNKAEVYGTYLNVFDAIRSEADLDEINVVKAIFLYTVSSDLIIKAPHESHEKILVDLSGLPEFRLREVLDRLQNERQVVYRRPDGIYQFFTGTNPRDLEQRVIAELEEQIKVLSNPLSLETIFANYCRDNLDKILGEESTKASQFASENGLNAPDWCFINQIYTIAEFEKLLQKTQAIVEVRNRGYHGIVAHVIENSVRELDGLWDEIDDLLQKSPIKDRLVVAIAKQSLGEEEENLGRILKKIETLKTKFKSEQGTPAYGKLLSGWETEIRDRSHEIFNKSASMRYHSISGHKIPLQERRYATNHVSGLMRDIYAFVPNMGNVDKLSIFPKIHPTGNKIAPTVASQLLSGNGQITFASLPKEASYTSAINGAFVKAWGIFKETSNAYILQEPTNQKVRDAWEQISKICDLKGEQKKEISLETIWKLLLDAPYGYNQLNFTVLLAGWLSFHRQEVSMRGIPDPTKKGKSKSDQSMQLKSLEEWAASSIFEKADTFVDEWIVKLGAKLIRSQRVAIPDAPILPTDYEKAIAYISQAENFLKENSGAETNSVREWKDRLGKSIKEFDRWYEPIKKVESLPINTPLSQLVPSYSYVLIDFSVTDIVKSSIYTDTQHLALQRMQQLLDERINELRIDPQSIEFSQVCNNSLSNLEAAISLLESNLALPEHYIQQLNSTKSAIADRKAQIQAQELIEQKLREIKARFDSLSPNATQSDYVAAIDFIEQVANEFSKIKSEEIYIDCLQKIGEFQESLQEQLQQWGSLYISENLSNELASELRDSIGKQSPRYTIANDHERLQEISEYLKQKILNIQIVDDLIKNNNRKLRQAEQELKAIRDAKALNVMFDGYKRTDILQLGTNLKIDTADQQVQLENLKNESLQVLIEKLSKTIDKLDIPISKAEEHSYRKNVLQQIQNLSSADINFAEIQAQIHKASISLEQRFEEFKKQSQDLQVMREIRRLVPSISMTIRNCEENTHKIHQLSQKLNYPEIYSAEYTQRIDSFQQQINQHIANFERLQEQIDRIQTEKELLDFQKIYHKSDLIFKDSSRYADYQKLQVKIDTLDEELAQVEELEAYKLKSGSISICELSRQQLSEASQNIADRFQPQVQAIEQFLIDRINQYRLDLENFDQRLVTITGLKTAQKSQIELAQKSVYYLNSEPDELLYNQIRDRLNRLQTLFQLVDGTEPQTINEYDQRLQKMQQWLEEDSQLPEWLDDRYLQKRRETEKNRQTLLDEKRKEAREWVKSIDLELQAALADSDRDRQAIKATELIKRIRNEKAEYFDGLINELEDQLGIIDQECQNILELDLESQIITRFRQLPQARRANLYAKLEAFLTDKTEEY